MKDQLLAQLNAAHEFFERSTRVLNDTDADFCPIEGAFSTAQHVAHVAQTIDWFIEGAFDPNGFDMNFDAHEQQIRAVTSLSDARAWLERAVAGARDAIDSHSDDDWMTPLPEGPVMGSAPRKAIFEAIADHTAHHRGALTVYTRLRGKTPAMPYLDM